VYLEEVKNCDVYVCLLGSEYGAEDAQGISSTEREFREATKQGKARLLFIKAGNDQDRHLKTMELIKRAGGEMIRRRFSNGTELVTQVYAALVQYLEDEGILQTVPFDASVCRGAAFSDIDETYVGNFLEAARAERKFPLPQNTSAKKLFAHLNLLTNDKISHAAVLLFCRKPQRFRPLICAEVKCMHFHTTEVRKPIPSYQIYKGTLFEQVDEAVDFVLGKIDRSVTPGKTGNASEVAYEIPKLVIREAIVNAIAHRDYTSNAGVQVMLFVDRLEVWNPGALPSGMTMKSLRTAHSSVPHNPLISEPLFWARYIERAGTGTLDMIALCRKAGIPEPEFEQRGGQFVLTIRRKKVIRQKAPIQPTAQVGPKLGLSWAQVEILHKCKQESKISELMKIVSRTNRTKFRDQVLTTLMKAGLLEMTFPDKPRSSKQKYRLTQRGAKYLKSK
jgi:predicted HTH transcriptional regulator